MTKNGEKTKLGWCVPKNIREDFSNFCAEKGTLIQEECAGALLIYQFLPGQIRETARLAAKGVEVVDSQFWKDFAAGIDFAMKSQSQPQHKKPPKKK